MKNAQKAMKITHFKQIFENFLKNIAFLRILEFFIGSSGFSNI